MTTRRFLALTIMALGFMVFAAPLSAATGTDPMSTMSDGRYLGTSDLPLLSAMLAAGGGATHFHATTLSAMLAAQHHDEEIARLDARFGTQRVTRYFATFDRFVDAAVGVAKAQHVVLPRSEPALAHDPYELAASLHAAGVMPDGRFDIGYFIEHLISRPIHIAVMHAADADPQIGADANADFHVILTSEFDDLASLYHLAR